MLSWSPGDLAGEVLLLGQGNQQPALRLPTKELQDAEEAAWHLNPEAGGGQTEEAFGDLFLSLSQQPEQGHGL